jgi:hypothetical protein
MDLSLSRLERAIGIRRRIDALEREFSSLFGGKGGGTAPKAGGQRRRMSPAARAKIAAAARARWAKIKGRGAAKAAPKKGGRKKGGLTPAGRRKLSQMMKARWAARRKAQRK